MFAQFEWTPTGRRLALGLSALAVVLYGFGALHFWNAYPSSYAWSELLISYEGGFVRRGLLGEIAFLLAPIVSAQLLLTVVFYVLYVLVAVRVIVLATGNLSYPSLLFALSPVALAFPLNDLEGYGRKDVIILAAFILALALIRRLAAAPTLAFLLIVLVYAVVGLVHEIGVIYFPAAVAFLLHTAGRNQSRRWTSGIAIATAAFLAVVFVLSVVFRGDAALEAAMVAAWQARVPGAFVPLHAADYLSEGILLTLAVMFNQSVSEIAIPGYLICALLGGMPVLVYALERPPALSTDRFRVVFARYALLVTLPVFIIAADWGRFIHLFWMHAFILIASLGTTRETPLPSLPTPRADPRMFAYLAALAFLYVFTWRMAHSVLRINPLWPGYIFDLQPMFRDIFGYAPLP